MIDIGVTMNLFYPEKISDLNIFPWEIPPNTFKKYSHITPWELEKELAMPFREKVMYTVISYFSIDIIRDFSLLE